MEPRNILLGLGAVLALTVGGAGLADAAVVFSTGSVEPLSNVHSSGPQSGMTVLGDLVSTGDVTFTSGINLTTNGSGVAQINGPWSTITYGMTDGSGIQVTDFSVNVKGKCDGCAVSFDASLVGGGADITGSLGLGNGDNKFYALASAGDLIKALTIKTYDATGAALDVDSLRQVKIGLAGAVPEPATWAMMLIGVGMVGAGLRSQRKRVTSATFA